DLPALKFAVMINGVTELIMMKADVLSDFKTIRACTHYMHEGKKIDYLPYDINTQLLTPIYTDIKGWNVDLTKMNKESELPHELVSYIDFIEEQTGVPVSIVSIGPDRTQTIIRKREKHGAL
ncbi:MAG TPA: adenylosuccinate synthetase, partial [Nitrosopumilaceae archaeon]|nr:adenylosuccinate synthetase [Nitrosopumilaceae archaeon]